MPLFESDVIVGADDLGHDVKFFGATSGRHLLWDQSQDQLEFKDNTKAIFGDGEDLQILHDGTQNLITSNTSNIKFIQNANDKDIIFQSDNGSGGVKTYFFLDGSVSATVFPDSSKLYFGTGHDAYIDHDGTNTYFNNQTGSLIIRTSTDDADLILQCDNGSGGTTAYLTLDGSSVTAHFEVDT